MKKGRLFVISGPSGTGKGTICKEINSSGGINLSVSMTTREPRKDEEHEKSYYFVDNETFDNILSIDGFLEHAEVYGSMYGTPKKPVMDALDKGEDVILEIDIQGAMKIKKSFPDGVFIFILPPSLDELEERLRKRGTEEEADVKLRMSTVVDEIGHIYQYDYYIVNDDLERASSNVKSIIKAEHSKIDDYTEKVVDYIIKNNVE